MGKTRKIVKNADGTSTVTVGGKYAGKLPRDSKKTPAKQLKPMKPAESPDAGEGKKELSIEEIWETYKTNIVEDPQAVHAQREKEAKQHLADLEKMIQDKHQNRTCVPSDKNSRVHTLVLVSSTRWSHDYGCVICGAQFGSPKKNGHPSNYVTGANVPPRDYEREFGTARPPEVFLEQKRTDWEKRNRFNHIAQKLRADKRAELGYGSTVKVSDVLEETLAVMKSEGYTEEEISEYVRMYSR